MSDIAAPEVAVWQQIEQEARRVLGLYHFEEVRTPVVEYTPVFTRSLGDTTEIVQKEMYTFEDRGGRLLSLRPEGTAGVIRFVAGAGKDTRPTRLYYLGPMFRCERPQAGRKRQFHQLGVESVGAPSPLADAEVIALQQNLLSAWGIRQSVVEINTRGLPEERKAVLDGLTSRLAARRGELCEDCRRRLETNVLRVLDCKQERCAAVVSGLPAVTEFMSEGSRRYLDEVVRLLRALDIPARLNPQLVRGLDYYVHTVWENRHAALGSQDAISGGGRYRIDMGGEVIEGVGFAIGLERAITAVLSERPETAAGGRGKLVWIVSQSPEALEENLRLAQMLRQRGVRCGLDLQGRSLKAQMRLANREGAALCVIRGAREMAAGQVVLKNMKDGAQEELGMPDLVERLVAAVRMEVAGS
jgi:histidyl-tRNA synthetase